jgi:hypothetical protein
MKNGEKLVHMKKREEASTPPTSASISRGNTKIFDTLPHLQSTRDTIYLDNPSFEGQPSMGVVPNGWYQTFTNRESPPDTQPGQFGVSLAAADGNTYLGMVCRDNNTYESVKQKLKMTLDTNQVYSFSVHLACADSYVSPSRLSGNQASYTTLIGLTVFGMNSVSKTPFLLAVIPQVMTRSWTEYELTLKPQEQVETIILQAYNPYSGPINGNILLDHCSPLIRVKE